MTIFGWFLFFFYYNFLILFHIQIFFIVLFAFIFCLIYSRINISSIIFFKYIFLCIFWNICFYLIYCYGGSISIFILECLNILKSCFFSFSFNSIDHLKAGNILFILVFSKSCLVIRHFFIGAFLAFFCFLLNIFLFFKVVVYVSLLLYVILLFYLFFNTSSSNFYVDIFLVLIAYYFSFWFVFEVLFFLYIYYFDTLLMLQEPCFFIFYTKTLLSDLLAIFFFITDVLSKFNSRWFLIYIYDYKFLTLYFWLHPSTHITYIYTLINFIINIIYILAFYFFYTLNTLTLYYCASNWYYELWCIYYTDFQIKYFFVNLFLFFNNVCDNIIMLSQFLVYYITVEFDGFFIFFHFSMKLLQRFISVCLFISRILLLFRTYIYPFNTFFFPATVKPEDNESGEDGSSSF